MPEHHRPKLVHEQVFMVLGQSARQVLDLFGEPECIIVSVLWDPSLGDIPGGMIASRAGQALSTQQLIRGIEALAKAQAGLLNELQSRLAEQKRLASKQEEQGNA